LSIHAKRSAKEGEAKLTGKYPGIWISVGGSMSEKFITFALSAMLFAFSYSASPQQPKKVKRVEYLTGLSICKTIP
jgi:hypothetical protein